MITPASDNGIGAWRRAKFRINGGQQYKVRKLFTFTPEGIGVVQTLPADIAKSPLLVVMA